MSDTIPNEVKFDWVPPRVRNRRQNLLVGEFHEVIGTFEDRATYLDKLPERCLHYDLEIKATGSLMPRPYQLTGSCVGVGGARAYCHAMCGDVVMRGESEEVIFPFPFATYGVGREIAGMRRPGEGSFGGAQAKACEQFGILPSTDSRLPQPTINDGWIYWTAAQEKQWSHPSAWPISRSELEKDSKQFQLQSVTRVTTIEGLCQAIAQGYGITTASMFGTRPSVKNGLLMGPWNDEWAHQQADAGYWFHEKNGLVLPCDNQWRDVHGHCPFLFKTYGVTGTYWRTEKDVERVLRDGEVYAHSNTEGFPLRIIDWGTGGFPS